MPNIVFNVLTVSGPNSKKEKVLAKTAISGNIVKTHDLTTVYCNFETTWATAWDWCDELAAKFPSLEFRLDYSEEFCSFEGFTRWKHGERLQNWYDASIPPIEARAIESRSQPDLENKPESVIAK